MKSIVYRGGLISFDIPKDWIEEYDESGGGCFYEDSKVSGTLRVNVLTIKEGENSNGKSIGQTIKESRSIEKSQITGEYNSLHGDAIIESISRIKERSIPIIQYRFDCIHKTNQMDWLVAIFTWTIESRFEKIPSYIEDIKMIRHNIMKLIFGR